jgi:hypothetical protein
LGSCAFLASPAALVARQKMTRSSEYVSRCSG